MSWRPAWAYSARALRGRGDATADNYRQDLKAHLIPILGDLRLDEIDAEAVQRLKAARASHHMASTVNNVLARLKTILRSAIEWKVIAMMPQLKRLKEPELEKPHYKQVDDEKLLAAARKADLKLYTVILLADDAGMRHGEVIALHKEDIRLDDELPTCCPRTAAPRRTS